MIPNRPKPTSKTKVGNIIKMTRGMPSTPKKELVAIGIVGGSAPSIAGTGRIFWKGEGGSLVDR